jgi:hypothetical protein
MEHGDMRNMPPLLQICSCQCGKPVMAEYQIVLEVVILPETLQVAGKVRKMGVHGQLMDLLVFPCPEVNEPCILIEFIDLAVFGVMDTSIDIH